MVNAQINFLHCSFNAKYFTNIYVENEPSFGDCFWFGYWSLIIITDPYSIIIICQLLAVSITNFILPLL